MNINVTADEIYLCLTKECKSPHVIKLIKDLKKYHNDCYILSLDEL
jgi:hypothetical protein